MCNRSGCEGADAFMVGFSFEAIGGSVPVIAESELRVCRDCASIVTLENTFDPGLCDVIGQVLASIGRAAPDPASFKLVLTPLN